MAPHESSLLLPSVIIVLISGLCAAIWLWWRQRRLNSMLGAVLGVTERPFLFYDLHGSLIYCSRGVLLFDRKGRSQIATPPVRPEAGQSTKGEIVIDFNRYRYVAKPLEYKPATFGVLIQLEYLGSVNKPNA